MSEPGGPGGPAYPQDPAGQPPGYPPGYGALPQYPPGDPRSSFLGGYPGAMSQVQTATTVSRRPVVVVWVFLLWVLTALLWPLGMLLRSVVAADQVTWSWWEFGIPMFVLGCAAVGWIALAARFLFGNWYARIGLCGFAFFSVVITIAYLVGAASDGTGLTGAGDTVAWAVMIARLVLAPLAAALSFLPAVNRYCTGGD